jgi:hypothetical protein
MFGLSEGLLLISVFLSFVLVIVLIIGLRKLFIHLKNSRK